MCDLPPCSCGLVCASRCLGRRTRRRPFSLTCRSAGRKRPSQDPPAGRRASPNWKLFLFPQQKREQLPQRGRVLQAGSGRSGRGASARVGSQFPSLEFLNSPVTAVTCVDVLCVFSLSPPQSVSRPDKVFFPPVNWKPTNNYVVEQDVGPAVEHIYEVILT